MRHGRHRPLSLPVLIGVIATLAFTAASAELPRVAKTVSAATDSCPSCRRAPDAAGRLPAGVVVNPATLGPADAERALALLSPSQLPSGPAATGTDGAAATSWRLVPPGGPRTVVTPPTRDGAGATYDAARGVVVVFGGRHYDDNNFFSVLDDTWTWDGNTWTEQDPATKPPARMFTVMAYDAALGKAVLFGGQSSTGPVLNDTWTWDGTNWAQVTTATSPPGRASPSLAYDEPRQKLVLFGGYSFPAYLGDTWLFDGTNWTLAVSPLSPTPRYGSNSLMTYVPANQGLVLFGGSDAVGSKNDTWLWNGTTWNLLLPAASPPGRFNTAIDYDAANARAVLHLFGANSQAPSDTWTWDGQNWQLRDIDGPASRFGQIFVYHPGVERLLMYSGAVCIGPGITPDDQWLWDGTRWRRSDLGEQSPRPRHYAEGQMAFDIENDHAVLFGGENGCQFLSDTWKWNGRLWTQLFPAARPAARIDASMAYDAERKLVVLFGGRDFAAYRNDTWSFDGVIWTRRSPATNPPPRIGAVMGFDSASRKIVLFGGRSPSANFTDTWTWDGSNWTQEMPATSPPGRVIASMSHDREGRPIVFGGVDITNGDQRGDTWRWNGADRNWEPVTTTGATPAPRCCSGMGYDARSESIILFGGLNSASFVSYADTWAFDGSNWQELSPSTSPSARAYFSMTNGSLTNPPILMGGSFPYVTGPGSAESWTWGIPSPRVVPVNVVSRKLHGSMGPFDINLPLTGTPGVEPRSGGTSNAHQVVLEFSGPVDFSDAAVNPASGKTAEADGPPLRSADGKEVTINLKNVSNVQTITVRVLGVSDGTNSNDVSVQIGVLLGDTTGDRVVNSGDITQTRRQSGQPTTESNKRIDLSVDGVIDSGDITLVRRQSGTALPRP